MFSKMFLFAFFAVIDVMCDDYPTLQPANPLYPAGDAKLLRKALEKTFLGISNPDEAAIINILAYRTLDQRLLIGEQYQKIYNVSLTDKLYEKLKEKEFRDAIQAFMTTRNYFYPKQLDIECQLGYLTYGLWVHRIDGIMEILLSFEYDHVRSYLFHEKNRWALVRHILAFTGSEISHDIILSFFNRTRDENPNGNETIVSKDVKDINATVGNWGETSSLFHDVFMLRSFPHLRRMFEVYANVTGKDIEQAIESEFEYDRDGKESYLAIVRYVRNKANYFASRLKNAMDRVFINTETLTRIVVGHAEIDLGNIMQYYKNYGTNLRDDIESGTSGYYRELMRALLGTYY